VTDNDRPLTRHEIAKKASLARWGTKEDRETPKATHRGELKMGTGIQCFVLGDGRRVLSQGGMISAMDMKFGTNPKQGADRLTNFASGKLIKPFISEGLRSLIGSPIFFRPHTGGDLAYGYEATTLVDLCEAVLKARDAAALQSQQLHIAKACDVLVRSFARVGIIALVDEATGYQADRAKDALGQILEAFIAKELRPYVKTFPAEFYKEMFRLREWDFPSEAHGTKRPPLVGKLTNNIVYARLAPGILNELRETTPRNDQGRLKHHYHRKLTEEFGHPKLREHLASVVTLMSISPDWDGFLRFMDRRHPKYNTTMEFDLDDLPVAPRPRPTPEA
jgi:hypothetical protein